MIGSPQLSAAEQDLWEQDSEEGFVGRWNPWSVPGNGSEREGFWA
jgi:hypothetical protein